MPSDTKWFAKIWKIIAEIKSLGYKILHADINASSDVWVYSIERDGFVPPLTAIKGVGSAAVQEIMENRPFKNLDELLFTEDGKWRPSKMNKTCFDSLSKVEAFGSLVEMESQTIKNHRQLYEIIVGNYDLLKKGRFGMTKTAAKRMMKERGMVPEFIPEKILECTDLCDWSRESKIAFSVDLLSGVDENLVFPPRIMNKIKNANVRSITDLSGSEKDVVWFCIQELYVKQTKNGKTYYRMKVTDNNSESCWLRVWGSFKNVPELYTMWLAEVASTDSWGCSTSTYKMKSLDIKA